MKSSTSPLQSESRNSCAAKAESVTCISKLNENNAGKSGIQLKTGEAYQL
jgi:hypothetical protein